MNKKELKKRLYPVNFRKQYQARILRIVEREIGLPSTCLCVFIAEIAKRVSNGKLDTKEGLILVSDKGKKQNPLVTAHVWNTYEGLRLDLSPWSASPYPVEYYCKGDLHYEEYKKQTMMFGDGPKDIFEEEMTRLVDAFHADYPTCGLPMNVDNFEHLRDQVRAACNGQLAFAFC